MYDYERDEYYGFEPEEIDEMFGPDLDAFDIDSYGLPETDVFDGL